MRTGIRLALVDPARRFTVRAAESPSGQGYTPFEGQELTGRVTATFLRGELAPADIPVSLGLPPFDATSIARGEAHTNPRPGGSMRPFCEPPITRSTPHSSMRKSYEASDEIVSTMNSAGCLARSIASRMSGMRLVTPVEVSLCTTMTAL